MADYDLGSLPDFDEQMLYFPQSRRLQRFRMPVSFRDQMLEESFRADQLEALNRRCQLVLRWSLPIIFVQLLLEVRGLLYVPNIMNCHYLMISSLLALFLASALLLCVLHRINVDSALFFSLFWHVAGLLSGYRAIAITGDDANTAYPQVSVIALKSDSLPLATMCTLVMIVFILLPLRCARSVLYVFLHPLVYGLLTIPMPSGFVEDDVSRRIHLLLRFIFLVVLAFAGRIALENSARAEYLSKVHLAKSLTKEKVLRFSAEHEAERTLQVFSQDRDESGNHSDEAKSQKTEATGLSTLIFSASTSKAMPVERLRETYQLRLRAIREKADRENWLISEDDLEVQQGRSLGNGGFGRLIPGRYARSDVAIKIADRKAEFDFEVPESLAHEFRILRKLRHPHIIGFFGACISVDRAEIMLVEELGPSTDMNRITKDPDLRFSVQAKAQHVLSDICSALHYLHAIKPSVAHGDLKAGNVLIDTASLKIKLVDFGLSQLQKHHRSAPLGGSKRWMAPEIFLKQPLLSHTATDIFSFGRLAFFAVTGLLPLSDDKELDILGQQYSSGHVPELPWHAADSGPLLEACQNLCERCLLFYAPMRPTASEVLSELQRWPQDPNQTQMRQFKPLTAKTINL